MNWNAAGVIITALGMACGLLYFALRSFVRAELSELRVNIMKDINGTYMRKDEIERLIQRADERQAGLGARLDRLENLP